LKIIEFKGTKYRVLHKIPADRVTDSIVKGIQHDQRIFSKQTNEEWFLEEIEEAEFSPIKAKSTKKKRTPSIILPAHPGQTIDIKA